MIIVTLNRKNAYINSEPIVRECIYLSEIFLLYIAIVVAFFLLGIIIGYIINPKKKLKKLKEKPLYDTVKDKPEENQELGQEMSENESNLQNDPYPNGQRYGYYNYNNYGSSFYGHNGRNRSSPR